MNVLEMSVEVLQKNVKPMHFKDIAVEIVSRFNLKKSQYISIDKLSSKISSSLAAHIRNKKTKSLVSKIPGKKKGTYKQGFYRAKRKREKNTIHALPEVKTSYTGKAGEFGVLSELLFRGYNASIMTVDEGIDVVATKGNKYFHIQVKTANSNKFKDKFHYVISKNSFKANNDASTYYVFILRRYLNDFWRSEFVVISSVILNSYILQGYIKKTENMSVTIKIDEENFMLNNKQNVTWALNKFDM